MAIWGLRLLDAFGFVVVAAGSFGLASALWPRAEVANTPAPAVAPERASSAGPAVAGGRARGARAAANLAGAAPDPILTSAAPTNRVPLPPLSELDVAGLGNKAARDMRSALQVAIGPHAFREPSCIPSDHPALTVVQFDLNVRSTPDQAVVTGAETLRVIDGPAVSPEVLACLQGRVPNPLVVKAPTAGAFPPFEGTASVRAFLSAGPGCQAEAPSRR
jgi:hypothetical protein